MSLIDEIAEILLRALNNERRREREAATPPPPVSSVKSKRRTRRAPRVKKETKAMAAKRKTAQEKREEKERRTEAYARRFLRDLAEAKTFRELYSLANSSRLERGAPGDEFHHWLGCALNSNPYDDAPKDVQAAIKAALARTTGK